MKALNKRIILLTSFIIFSFLSVGTVFAQVGYSNFREGDIPYIAPRGLYPGHVGILYKKGGQWWVRESRLQDFGVVSRPFISFYERYAKAGDTVKLLEVNCYDSEARHAADWAKITGGLYSYPSLMPVSYSCSSFVWAAYHEGPHIDVRVPADPLTDPDYILPLEIWGSPSTRDEGVIQVLRLGDVSGNGSVSAYDASLAARYRVHLINLTYEQIQAADVTGNGTVSATDAAWILRKAVGLIDTFPIEEMKSRTSTSKIGLEEQLTVTVGSACGSPGDVNIEIPITVSDVTGLGIIGLDLQLEDDASQLSFSHLSTVGTIVEGWPYAVNEGTLGSIKIAFYNTQSMVGRGRLLKIYLNVGTQAVNGTSTLSLAKAEFNEGAVTSLLEDGSLTVNVIQIRGDVNRDCNVDIFDLSVLCSHWLAQDCNDPNWCERTDLDYNHSVDFVDFAIFTYDWLESTGP